jgi:hypothetical protein
MLVGITPGLHQATEALAEARRSLANGLSPEDALRRADAVGSFSGPLRTYLVTMLDGIGLAAALGIESTAQLFDEMHHLAGHVSAIDYPVFVHGRNYGGASPPLVGHPVLASLVRLPGAQGCDGARRACGAPGKGRRGRRELLGTSGTPGPSTVLARRSSSFRSQRASDTSVRRAACRSGTRCPHVERLTGPLSSRAVKDLVGAGGLEPSTSAV